MSAPVDARTLTYVPLDEVAGAARNPKGHDLAGIQASISRFGFVSPSVIDGRTGRLVVGHGRVLALRAMRDAGQQPPAGVRLDNDGAWCVPVLAGWSSRSDSEAEAYLVADNEWTVRGGWNDAELAELLNDIGAADPDLLAVTGFTDEDVMALLGAAGSGEPDDDTADQVPEPPADPVTRPGDVWRLGRHRIMCGDCRDPQVFAALLDGATVNLAFTSPPYASQRTYDESSGFRPVPPDEYVEWFTPVQANVRARLADDGSWFVNIKEHAENGQRHLYVKDLTIAHVRQWDWRFVDELIWLDSKNGFPGTWPNRFKDAWESVFHFSQGGAIKFRPMANATPTDDLIVFSPETHIAANDGNGSGYFESAKTRKVTSGLARPSNVIALPAGCERGISHSASFPSGLPAWFLRAYTDPGDSVLDPFMGSGSTLIAAERENRTGYGIEISPAYCDVICRRYQQETGEMPTRNGKPHDFERDDDDG